MNYEKQREKVEPPRIGLAQLRKSHGMTQDQVAEAVASIIDEPFLGTSLSLIEGGHRGASAEVLRALEQVFRTGPGSMAVDYQPSHSRRSLKAVGE